MATLETLEEIQKMSGRVISLKEIISSGRYHGDLWGSLREKNERELKSTEEKLRMFLLSEIMSPDIIKILSQELNERRSNIFVKMAPIQEELRVLSRCLRGTEQEHLRKERLGALKKSFDATGERLKSLSELKTSFEKALKAGYSPIIPNPDWFIGYVDPPKNLKGGDSYALIKQEIPLNILERYNRARKSGIFDAILVASPHSEDFSVHSIPVPGEDPLMVGVISEQRDLLPIFTYHHGRPKVLSLINGYCSFFFEIGYWGLASDMKGKK